MDPEGSEDHWLEYGSKDKILLLAVFKMQSCGEETMDVTSQILAS
jgi:hypothetical protein